MTKYYKLIAMGLVSIMSVSLASCSDDDGPDGPGVSGEPTTENVFTEGLPANVSGATFSTNDKGQLTKIVDGSTNITFEYGSFSPSRAHTFTVLMKERDSQYPDEGSDIYMELNKQGFVAYAYQVYLDDEDECDEWWFEYNNDGQLTRMRRSESGDDYRIVYANGDIVKVTETDEDGDYCEYTFKYTNEEYTTAVANKGCVMMFDNSFHVQTDEMEVAYYAGLLGKATKNLPMGYTEKNNEGDTDTETYHWIFNADKLPTKFWDGDFDYDAVTFVW